LLHQISYDLNRPGQNYDELFVAIKAIGPCIKPLKSLWVVSCTLSANEVWERLKSHIDKSDQMLISEVNSNRQGWLEKDDWDWINSH